LAAFALLTLATTSALMFAPFTGAIYTTDGSCTGVNLNIYNNRDAVYLDGGPNGSGSGLATGYYYVKVTEPGGAVLGTSVGTVTPTPVGVGHVNAGKFDQCYQLSLIVYKADASLGYEPTTSGGGEYKVWISPDPDFVQQKTDNFKVKETEVIQQGSLSVIKFYDANANGIDDAEAQITGWKVRIQDGLDLIRFTPTTVLVDADDYVVSEFSPAETNWMRTTPNPVNITLANGDTKTVEFGNLCLGAGGGLTLGYWSNKNGAKVITGPPALLAGVEALCLRKADGTLLGNVSLATFQSFLTGANATNMANMLSAQLAAMKLNVSSGGASGGALIYAPGTSSANALGFATVNAVMAEANAMLCSGGATPLLIMSGNPDRPRAEALKTALDKANNNLTFVQAAPCAFTF
jgi:hypothetical protein